MGQPQEQVIDMPRRLGLLALRSEQIICRLEKKLCHYPDGLYEIGHSVRKESA